MTTPERAGDRHLAVVLDELIDVVRETKQIEWIAHHGETRQRLDELEAFLIPQLAEITRIEAETGSPLARIVTPSVHHALEPMGAASASEVVRNRLVPHLLTLAADVRDCARECGAAERDFLEQLATDLEEHAAQVQS
jgi:hypothetical protein